MFVKDFVENLKTNVIVYYREYSKEDPYLVKHRFYKRLPNITEHRDYGLMVIDRVTDSLKNKIYLAVVSSKFRPFINFKEFSEHTGFKDGDIIIFRRFRNDHEFRFRITEHTNNRIYSITDEYSTHIGLPESSLLEYKKGDKWLPFGVKL